MASLYQRPNTVGWWAKYRQGGQIIRGSPGCIEKREGQEGLDIRAGQVAEGQPLPVKLDAITYDELRKDLDAAYAVKSIRSLGYVTVRMKHLDAAFWGWRAINITESQIDAYAARRKTETVPGTERLGAPATVNRELAQFKRMLPRA